MTNIYKQNTSLLSAGILLWSLIITFLFNVDAAYAQNSGLFNIVWDNPLSVGTIEELIIAILNIVTIIAIPIITLFIIYAGFLYVTARGNAEQIRTATTALTFAIIGAILIIGAVAVTTIMGNTIAQFAN